VRKLKINWIFYLSCYCTSQCEILLANISIHSLQKLLSCCLIPTFQPAVCLLRPALNELAAHQIMPAAWGDNQKLYVTPPPFISRSINYSYWLYTAGNEQLRSAVNLVLVLALFGPEPFNWVTKILYTRCVWIVLYTTLCLLSWGIYRSVSVFLQCVRYLCFSEEHNGCKGTRT